jgi:uroporphyrin-III C-methyltransferase
MRQEEINALMLKLALRGLKVVRLKGGDPSIFGRSGEEKAYLEARGVEVEVVPGVTAASAAAAQFGFPLTHRGEARRLVLVTARVKDGALLDTGWDACADAETTVAVYMGREAAGAVAARLMAAGRAGSTSVAIVENAGRPGARLIQASLATLEAAVDRTAMAGPVVVLIGQPTARADQAVDSPALTSAALTRSRVNGARLSLTPVASNMALAMAGATGREDGSPAPEGASSGRFKRTMSTDSGASAISRIG